ncbi:MAG: MgtC/SapB family protein [Rhodospirillaceae bacterium]|nr:MgtC/SapB family protein [Rhodospirillaceae bacterium]
MAIDVTAIEHLPTFRNLGVALAAGLLIGLERGWRGRDLVEGGRFAGLRTFGLIGLFGGIVGTLAVDFDRRLAGYGLFVTGILIGLGYWLSAKESLRIGLTTAFAALLAFTFGVLAAQNHLVVAASGAVATAVLLGAKEVTHNWLQRIEPRELGAALQLLLISVVILPILPDQNYGPYGSLNPYRLWWAVVLISGLSFIGYVSMRIVGTKRGLVLTGIFGGLASSTATTLMLSRFARERTAFVNLASASITAACGIMLLRIIVLAGAVEPRLLPHLALPIGSMLLTAMVLGWWFWRRPKSNDISIQQTVSNPFEIGPAVGFGVLLSAILVLANALQDLVGTQGLYLLALASGLADVDAITVSVGKMAAAGTVSTSAAWRAIIIAAGANIAVKIVLIRITCGGLLARQMAGAFGVMLLAGILAYWADASLLGYDR